MPLNKCNLPFEADFRQPETDIFAERRFDIRDYVAGNPSETDKKRLIQKVVEICREAGGGTVAVGRGKWLSGPIRLYDNIRLELHENAEIMFSSEPEDYLPVVFTRWEGMECYNYSPLIYANGCKNIAITGKGTLNGMGQPWWHWKLKQGDAAKELCYAQSNGVPVEKRVYGTREAALRPSFIQFINCQDVLLSDFVIREGPQWTIHPVYCENVTVKGVTVRTTGHNTDGLNPDSCKNVWIEGCDFSTGDDCIAINSGMNEDGWRVGRPCENIVITDCVMSGGHGAVVIGSGMSGGVRNIFVSHCEANDTMQGIRIKSMRGRGGYIRDVWFENITLNRIRNEAIQISMFYPYSTVPPRSDIPPQVRDIRIKNISGGHNNIALEIRGLEEESLKRIEMENINLSARKSILAENVSDVSFKDVNICCDS